MNAFSHAADEDHRDGPDPRPTRMKGLDALIAAGTDIVRLNFSQRHTRLALRTVPAREAAAARAGSHGCDSAGPRWSEDSQQVCSRADVRSVSRLAASSDRDRLGDRPARPMSTTFDGLAPKCQSRRTPASPTV